LRQQLQQIPNARMHLMPQTTGTTQLRLQMPDGSSCMCLQHCHCCPEACFYESKQSDK
jgi:hypothetical protein